VLPTPFLDLSSEIALDFVEEDERGLLSLAFDPAYATTGFFYVLIATTSSTPPDVDGRIEVRRYQVSENPNVANPGTMTPLLSLAHPPRVQGGTFEFYHNGGTLAFGPGDDLWATIGDGGGWFGNDPNNCSQDAASPLGKLLRIDRSQLPQGGVIVPFGNPCPHLPVQSAVTVVAKGLRNPWRFSFDRNTGDLYLGDVGEEAAEEVDVVAAGDLDGPTLNFGWRAWEGNDQNPAVCPGDPLCNNSGDVTFPVHTYGHTEEYCAGSVTGGFVYRGSNAALEGKYLFADFCQNFFRSFVWDGDGGVTGSIDDLTSQLDPLGQISFPVSFGEDAAGELYIVDFDFGGGGEIFRIPVPEPGFTHGLIAAFASVLALRRAGESGRRQRP